MRKLYLALSMCFVVAYSYAQPGQIDPTFNPSDPGYGYGDGPSNYLHDMELTPNGSLLIVGAFTKYNGLACDRLAHVMPDGSLFPGFSTGTGFNGIVIGARVQNDGKILAFGAFTNYNGEDCSGLVRLNIDGSLDATFETPASPDVTVYDVLVLSTGKILVGGYFTSYNGQPTGHIIRLNTDGTIDGVFNVGAGFNGGISDLYEDPSGRILVSGQFTTLDNDNVPKIVRLLANGALDSSFNIGSGPNQLTGGYFGMQSDGKIIYVGDFQLFSGTTAVCIVRLLDNGSVDPTFNSASTVDYANAERIRSVAVASNDKLIVYGDFSGYNGSSSKHIARLDVNGNVDVSFATSNADQQVFDALITTSNEVFVGGLFTHYQNFHRPYCVKLDNNGGLIPNYNPGTGCSDFVSDLNQYPGNKTIVTGFFSRYGSSLAPGVQRILADGSPDPTWIGGIGMDNVVMTSAVDVSGKVYLGGWFSNYLGNAVHQLVRLNDNGTLDPTFNPGSGPNNFNGINSIALQQDGKVLVGGLFTAFNGITKRNIVRLEQNGSVDLSFDVGLGPNGIVNDLKYDLNGKIMVGGSFASFAGVSTGSLVRLLPDGSLDPTFSLGSGLDGQVLDIVILADGNYLVLGVFTQYNGFAVSNIVRLLPNGELDPSFNYGLGFNGETYRAIEDSEGRYIVAGNFISYNGVAQNALSRLMPNGSLDLTFQVGTGVSPVFAMSLSSDDDFLLGGAFISYNGTGRNRIAKVNGGCLEPTVPTIGTSTNNNCGQIATVLSITGGSLNGASDWYWYVGSCGGTPIGQGNTLLVNPAATTTYFVRGEGGCATAGSCASITITVFDPTNYYYDGDGDGYASVVLSSCSDPGAGYTSTMLPLGDCNDANPAIRPGAVELCGNGVDDDCDGFIDEGCAPSAIVNDGFGNATLAPTSGSAYPVGNCYNGTLVGSTPSPQGNVFNVLPAGGQDVWYRFVALSQASRVVCSSTSFNVVLELHDALGAEVDVENDVSAVGGEIMISSGLIPGQTYYAAVRSYDGTLGDFNVCIQNLLGSTCADGPGTYDLCTNFKPTYSGAASYTTTFTPINGTPGVPTSVTTPSQFALSNTSLSLRHNGQYSVSLVSNFVLQDAAGNNENISINSGSTCTITIAPHADLRTKDTQVCPTTILKGSTLQAKPFVCGAINHTIEFVEVSDCTGSVLVGAPFTVNTTGSSSSRALSSVGGVQPGKWYRVRWRPNFAYGSGTYGSPDIIQIAAASQAIVDANNTEFDYEVLALYPNPNDGSSFWLEFVPMDAKATIEVFEITGKMVFSEQWSNIALNGERLKVAVNSNLSAGCYVVKLRSGNEMVQTRMIVR